ncbi:13779_t:CDS:2 [Acaulospora colombiana]|uniref:13779_t:CDS:1 n=1 Tax=Acaulospora colombiana TaxID=27376 RepID=A0ACA9KTL2_9GLOM|nr:13779_t:CDS:2 [Acaulospora colombiana]
MSDVIREPRLEATKFFKYQIGKNALCVHEFFKSVYASRWSLSAFVKYIAKLETGLCFEQLFKVYVKSLDQICVLLVVPACVRAFAQNYLKWLETCTGKTLVNEYREYFLAKVTLQEKTELKDDTVNVTAQAEAYRAYITAPVVPTKSSTSFSEDQLSEYHTQQTDGTYTGDESDRGTDEDVQERHNDKVDEELIEASAEKKRKYEDDVKSAKRSRSRYESPYSSSSSEPNPFLVGNQNDHNIDEEGDEFNAYLTIVGGKSADWIINGNNIREKLTNYQLEANPPKTHPEYYDIIFFNLNDEGGFLSTLDKGIVAQMRKDIKMAEVDSKNQEIKLFMKNIIDRDIKKTKENLRKKIDTIICMREEDKEFSVTEVSGPPLKNDWTLFMGDRMKIMKMLKTLMNQFAKLNPSSDITLIRLFGLQAYLNELTIYEFKLKYTEVYTTEAILTFPLPKTWADMVNSDKAIMGLLKYEVRINGF